jgi:hypothetical protein
LIALLFGNTAAIFMSMYFGHGVAAWALLAGFLCLMNRRYVWLGFFFGISALSDYGTIFVAPAFLAAACLAHGRRAEDSSKPQWKTLFLQICLGGAIPLAFWIWYHTACFGKPWTLPMKYQNPDFVDTGATSHTLWGVAAPIPDPVIILKLCFGSFRGILFTQPWMWVFFPAVSVLGWRRKLTRPQVLGAVFSLGGLLGLLWMNGSFNGWHAGATPGPRYLCIIFPCVALMAGWIYDRLSIWVRKLFWATLGISVVFRVLVYCTTPLPSENGTPVWKFLGYEFRHADQLPRRLVTFALVCAVMIWASRWAWRHREERALAASRDLGYDRPQ